MQELTLPEQPTSTSITVAGIFRPNNRETNGNGVYYAGFFGTALTSLFICFRLGSPVMALLVFLLGERLARHSQDLKRDFDEARPPGP